MLKNPNSTMRIPREKVTFSLIIKPFGQALC